MGTQPHPLVDILPMASFTTIAQVTGNNTDAIASKAQDTYLWFVMEEVRSRALLPQNCSCMDQQICYHLRAC